MNGRQERISAWASGCAARCIPACRRSSTYSFRNQVGRVDGRHNLARLHFIDNVLPNSPPSKQSSRPLYGSVCQIYNYHCFQEGGGG